MKCLHCYAENPAWQTLCSACGEPVTPVEICGAGHILPPGVRECPLCPTLWPQVAPFSGPPILRGILWVESGELHVAGDFARHEYFELRDMELPYSLTSRSPLVADVASADLQDAAIKLLVRPGEISLCGKPAAGRSGPAAPRYEPLRDGATVELERVRMRLVPIAAPAWTQTHAGR
ncbi:MAG: hypothetical protein ACKVU1_11345 [bacterium]